MPFLLKTSQGNLLKTFPSNLLKPFLGNPLKTAKHIPLSICPLFAFLRFYRSVSPPIVSLFSLSRLCFELIKTAHPFTIASRLVPRLVPSSRHARRPPRVPISRCLPFIAIRLGSPCFSPIGPPHRTPPPNRHAKRGEERGEDDCLVFLLILSVAIILL